MRYYDVQTRITIAAEDAADAEKKVEALLFRTDAPISYEIKSATLPTYLDDAEDATEAMQWEVRQQ